MLRVRLRALPEPVQVVVPDTFNYGLLYNFYAATDAREITSSDNWSSDTIDYSNLIFQLDPLATEAAVGSIVPTGQIVASESAGLLIKEIGINHWESPNNGATNSFGFNLRGAGFRSSDDGTFNSIKEAANLWAFDILTNFFVNEPGSSFEIQSVSNYSDSNSGYSIRLTRPATESELLLPDGLIAATYTGNDGKVYRLTKIGTQVWIADYLAETKFRNGDWIPGFDAGVYTPFTDAAWAALETAGCCAYNDDTSNI